MPQVPSSDLFLETLLDAPLRDDRALMEFPFFSLKKQPRMAPIVYQNDQGVRIEVSPGQKGIATIWDKDVLIYIVSILNRSVERGQEPSRVIRFPAYDFLTVTGRGISKATYEQFLDALFRLRSTTIVTTLQAGGKTERRGFGWIETFEVIEKERLDGKKVMAGVAVTLNDWMYRAIVRDRRVLSINPRYFQLTMGLEKRLYELARKHVGRQDDWLIGLEKLHAKCGSESNLRKFKFQLNEVIERDAIPDYRIRLINDHASEIGRDLGVRGAGRRRDDNRLIKVAIYRRPEADDIEVIHSDRSAL